MGVFSSAVTSFTPSPFFFHQHLPFLSLSLSLALPCLWDPGPLYLVGLLGTLILQFGLLIQGQFHLGLPDVGWRALLRRVRLVLHVRSGLMGGARLVVVVMEGSVRPVAHQSALTVSSNELPKGQQQIADVAGLLLFPLLPLLLKGLPASCVASFVQVIGHQGA